MGRVQTGFAVFLCFLFYLIIMFMAMYPLFEQVQPKSRRILMATNVFLASVAFAYLAYMIMPY